MPTLRRFADGDWFGWVGLARGALPYGSRLNVRRHLCADFCTCEVIGPGGKLGVVALGMNDWNEAEHRVEKAQEFFEQRRWQEALDELQAATAINPYNSAWFFNIGLTLDEMERFDEAIEAYRRSLEIDANDLQAMNHLGVDLHRSGQHDTALATFNKIETIDPSFEPSYCNRIVVFSDMGNHEKAEEMFYLARLYLEHCPHCYFNMGRSLAKRGLFDRAIYCWHKTLDLDDRYPAVRFHIADALWKKKELEAARQHFLAGLRQDPGNTDALLDLGELLLEMGQIEESGEKFRRAIELSPENASAYFRHGCWLVRVERDVEAIKAFVKTLRLDPTFPGAHLRLGEIFRRQRNRGQARRHLRAELLLRPQDSQLLLDLSNLLMDNGQRRAAVACLKRMVLARPDNVSGWQNLAIAQFMRGQYDDGIASCREVLERDPKNLATMFNLALAYEQLGRYDRAMVWVGNGLVVEPRDPSFENLRLRLRMLKTMGRFRRAVRAMLPWW